MSGLIRPRADLLAMALRCGAELKGKPDGSEPIGLEFSVDAWKAFDAALMAMGSKQIGGNDGEE